MKYTLVASSRSRVTENYKGEDGSLIQVYYYKSGVVEATHISEVDSSLTVRYQDGEVWETDPIPSEGVRFPVVKFQSPFED